jgi:hypothetical protein
MIDPVLWALDCIVPAMAGGGVTGCSARAAEDAPGPLGPGAFDGSHPLDVRASLAEAMEEGSLAAVLPWVLRYLWFLGGDPRAARTRYFRWRLRRLP